MLLEACRGTIGTETSQAQYAAFELDVISAGGYVPALNGRYMPRMLLSEWREYLPARLPWPAATSAGPLGVVADSLSVRYQSLEPPSHALYQSDADEPHCAYARRFDRLDD